MKDLCSVLQTTSRLPLSTSARCVFSIAAASAAFACVCVCAQMESKMFVCRLGLIYEQLHNGYVVFQGARKFLLVPFSARFSTPSPAFALGARLKLLRQVHQRLDRTREKER